MNIASTTEQSTKKVKQSTKKPRKQNEDEFQRQTGSDDASDSGLSSLVIAAITVGCACVIFILVLTVYILLPKLRKSEHRPNETAHHLNGHVHHDTNNFSLLNGKSEHMNGGLKFIKTSTFQTDFESKSETIDNFDVERISISTKL